MTSFATVLLLLLASSTSQAFTTSRNTFICTSNRLYSKVSLYSSSNNNNHEEKSFETSRREAVATSAALSAAALVGATPLSSLADDEEGRLIEFEVANLDGEEGKTGTFVIRTKPSWAPKGAKRFEDLTEKSFWDGCRIFRVLPGFVSQFGINGDPKTQSYWRSQSLSDDPVKVSNTRGTVVFATAGPNTRTTQIFINTGNRNSFLDNQGFSPFGEVVSGMDVVDRMYSGYGEGAPRGNGPNQGLIQSKGNEYLEKSYPKLSYFTKATFK
eukprot:CAMPEP_0185734892 /NCGR_PEP_ID=MMETSP1171-20130828/23750_1 /TAXON_ID=374046 /ORGANISM="Helicotheca tamensis, Strain CCMP826" /LENGTH=269 /DNA_ID=CAMNT_0028405021 /DNA_START=56 /DNA_END=865 /DNA_ORIENTATION=+